MCNNTIQDCNAKKNKKNKCQKKEKFQFQRLHIFWKEIFIGEGVCVGGDVHGLGCLCLQVTESLDSSSLQQ